MPQFQPRQKVLTGQTPIHKFTTKGEVVEGVYKGKRQLNAQYKPLYQVGDKLIAASKVVEDAIELTPIPVGAYVWVTWNGKVNIKGGKTLNDIEIEFALPEGAGEAAQKPPAKPSEDPALVAEYERLAAGAAPSIRKAVDSMFPDLASRIAKFKSLVPTAAV